MIMIWHMIDDFVSEMVCHGFYAFSPGNIFCVCFNFRLHDKGKKWFFISFTHICSCLLNSYILTSSVQSLTRIFILSLSWVLLPLLPTVEYSTPSTHFSAFHFTSHVFGALFVLSHQCLHINAHHRLRSLDPLSSSLHFTEETRQNL